MSLAHDYIARIDVLLTNYNDAAASDLVKEVVSVFADAIPGIKKGLDRYRGRIIAAGTPVLYDNLGDLRKLKGKLLLFSEANDSADRGTHTAQYFNLVVRADPNSPMPESRMLEGVPDEVANVFRRDGKSDLNALSSLPTIMTSEFDEADKSAMALLGYIETASLNPIIKNPVMAFPSYCLIEKGCLEKWGNKRTRWAVIEGNPFRLFADCITSSATQKTVAVNQLGSGEMAIDERLVAVMMPFEFEPELDNVYIAIKAACAESGFHCARVDELATPTDITDDIRNLICRARVIVADISGENPNVMFELGFACGKDKPVVIISSDDLGKLPFDIRQQRVLPYTKSALGLKGLTDKLADWLSKLDC